MKLGKALKMGVAKSLEIDDSKEYTIAGVQSYGKGVVNRRNEFGKNLKMKKYQVIEPDFLMWCKVDTKNGAFGITKEEHKGSLASTNMALAKIETERFNPQFIERLFTFDFFHGYITHLSSGSTNRKYLTPKQLFELVEIPALNKKEQDEFISLVDRIENLGVSTVLNHQLNLVKQIRQAFLREAMQGKLVPQDPNDEPASELLKRIKAEKDQLIKQGKIKKQKPLPPISEEEIPFEIPENWVWCRLGEITNYGFSPKSDPSELSPETWILDLEDIEKESSILISRVRFKERKSLSTKSKFETNDVLYSKLRPYLDKVIVADEPGVCTTEILPLKTFAGMNPFFLKYTLKRSDFLSYVNSVTKGMKMPRLGTKDGELAIIPLPPLLEQQHIVSKLDELMAYCDELEVSIKESQQHNELLLQQVLREALKPKKISTKT